MLKQVVTGLSILFILPAVSAPHARAAPEYHIDRYAVGSAGGESDSADFHLVGIAGQPAAGLAVGDFHVLNAGFWPGNIGCTVNVTDLALLADVWLSDSRAFGYDLEDFSVLAAYWLCQCPPDWPLK